jgi:hypothetical protein
MKKNLLLPALLFAMSTAFFSCNQSEEIKVNQVPTDVLDNLTRLGFDVTDIAPIAFEDGYLVEGDIYLTAHDLSSMKAGARVPNVEQYSTNNLVSGTPRTIKVYISSSQYSATYIAAVDEMNARFNALNLGLTFTRVTSSSGATVSFSKLTKRQERQGILGSSGFPTSSGNPYNVIKMSSILESTYGLTVNGIATIMAHEMGHCIGFRHTDYYNRAISCGGAASNEGAGTVGANLIPGTPATATLAAKSWMLACTDGGDRPFNNDDKTALNYLY